MPSRLPGLVHRYASIDRLNERRGGPGPDRGRAFLLRPELCEPWDLLVWLHISFEAMVARAVERDVAWAGDPELVRRPYTGHWTKVHERYERQAGGQDRADLVVDNSLPGRPRVLRADWRLT